MQNRQRATERRAREHSDTTPSKGREEHGQEEMQALEHEREEYEYEYEEEEEEEEKSFDKLEAYKPDETKGVLLRFLQGIQPVSYVYWEN